MDMVERLRSGEPLQYLCGSWGFRRLDLLVDPRVLIPRPETELLVEAALEELTFLRADRPVTESLVVVDLGTGSGAIALALADEAPARAGEVEVWATDSSAEALEVAAANRARLDDRGASRVQLRRGDWWAGLPAELAGRVDMVVSNPPYVAEADEVEEKVSRWEPAGALWSGRSGLEATEAILAGAAPWLAPRSGLVLELATERADLTLALVRAHGWEASVRDDLAGRARLVVGRRASGDPQPSRHPRPGAEP